jgi:hypothetical protein
VATTLALGLSACDPGGSDSSSSASGRGDPAAQVAALPASDLTAADRAAIVQMREEEKLARDVYTTLGDQWGSQIFSNISQSEQTHMDAVGALLDKYGIADPAAGNEVGVFTDPHLQALYDQLVAQGRGSLVDALRVGATIEDLDIADLRSFATDAADVQSVWDTLERGSRNHLRAFTSQLDRNGASYTPQYISQADFDAIVGSGTESGSGR